MPYEFSMQQFVIPQFIDVEDKIIGPVTVRQFIILLVGMFFIFLTYKLADFALFLVIGLLFLFITIVLAFVRINGQPFHFFLLNFIQTFRRPSLQIWYKVPDMSNVNRKEKFLKKTLPPLLPKVKISSSRLSELSLVVDTGGMYQGEKL